jgi:FkbM family methyltransferase
MRIGRRSPAVFLRRITDPNNYAALAGIFRVHVHPLRAVLDEIFSSGTYPRSVTFRTPIGKAEARLHSPSDLSTLNLIFCRGDYYAPDGIRTVLDIGSNIGLSALFWLTRNREAMVHGYEPAPISYGRLEENLRLFRDRVVLHQAAVSDFKGMARLGIEASGVNSSLDLVAPESVECPVVHINDALESVLRGRGTLDVLKVDSEGHELRTLKAIAPEFWPRIRCLNVDVPGAAAVVPSGFHHRHVSSAEQFWR